MANEEVLELQIRDNAADAAESLYRLSDALTRVKESIGKGLNLKGVANGIEKLRTAINNGIDDAQLAKFERLADILERLKSVGSLKISGIKNVANQFDENGALADAREVMKDTASGIEAIDRGMETVGPRVAEATEAMSDMKDEIGQAGDAVDRLDFDKYVNMSKVDLLTIKYNTLKNSMEEMASAGRLTEEQAANGALRLADLRKQIDRVTESMSEAGEATNQFGGKFKQLLSDFGRIIKYRAIRNVIKQITQAFKEGIENLYFYSKAMGTDFAKSMDSAASSLLYLKNSLGAAVSPILTSLIPVLNTVVDIVVEIINVINQLFALLTGKTTWTKAVKTEVDAFTKTGKAAKAAGNSIKELLADWDELNIIQSESGKASAATGDYAKNFNEMFEEVQLPQWMLEWKPIIEAVLAGTLGAIILPKIFDWIKRIFGLFGGAGAEKAIDLVSKLLDPGSKLPNVPNIGDAATQMGIFAAASSLASTTLPIVVEELTKLKGIFEGLDLVKNFLALLTGILANALGVGKIKISVDSEKFKEFKEQYEDFKKDNKVLEITVMFDHARSTDFWRDKEMIDEWCSSEAVKNIVVLTDPVRSSDYTRDRKAIDEWIDTTGIKKIAIVIDHTRSSDYTRDKNTIDAWAKTTGIKNIAILVDHVRSSDFTRDKHMVDEWLGETGIKRIAVVIDRTMSSDYMRDRNTIDKWLDTVGQKTISFSFDMPDITSAVSEMGLFAISAAIASDKLKSVAEQMQTLKSVLEEFDLSKNLVFLLINAWTAEVGTKTIQVNIVDTDDALKNLIDWIDRIDTKTINLKMNYVDDNSQPVQTETPKSTNKKNPWTQPIWEIDWDEFGKYVSEPNSFLPVLGDLLQGLRETFGGLFGGSKKKTTSSPALTDVLSYQVSDDLYKEANETVEELYSDIAELIDKSNLKNKDDIHEKLMDLFDLGDLSTLKLLKQQIDESGLESALKQFGWNTGNLGTRQLASAGMSDTSYTPYVVKTDDGSNQTSEQMVANMESSMKKANEPQNELLNQLITIAKQINSKDFSVKVTPSSSWGQFGAISGRAFAKVIGENP